MRYLLKKQIRDFKNAVFLNVSVFLITFLGIFFFSGLSSVGQKLEKGIDDFYNSQNLADYTVTAKISAEKVKTLEETLRVDGATEFDAVTFKVGGINRNVCVSVFPYKDFEVNVPYLTDGKMPSESFDGLIDVAFAEANGIKIGDVYSIKIEGQPHDIRITGFAKFPDHLYKGVALPELKETGILKVFVDLELDVDTLYIASDMEKQTLLDTLQELTGSDLSNARVLDRTENISVMRISADLDLISTIMSILPAICLVALCLILYVNASKRVEDESYNIGVLNANGIDKRKILLSYLLPYLGIVMIAGLLGAIIGTLVLPNLYISMLERFYTLPAIGNRLNVLAIIIPTVALAAVTTLTLVIAMAGLLRKTPSDLMRGKGHNGVKVLAASKLPIIFKLSLRNFLTYRKKTFFTVISATLCLSLLFTAFILNNSVTNLRETVYETYYNYDYTVAWNAGDKLSYGDLKEAASEAGLFENIMYCLEFPARNFDTQQSVTVSIIDETDPCYNVFYEDEKVIFGSEGVYVPSSYGDMENIKLTVYADTPFEIELPVVGKYKDMGMLGVIVPLGAIKNLNALVYAYLIGSDQLTKLFMNRRDDVTEDELDAFIISLENKFEAAFMPEVHDSTSERFKQHFAVLDITEWVLFVICGAIMILLILNISRLSLADRVKDHTVFKALGLNAYKINLMGALENYFSLIIAYIAALPLGLLITEFLLKAVRQITGVVVYVAIYATSAIILFAGAMLFMTIASLLISAKISKLNLAYTLKIKE